jgi:hypothetical protein
MPISLRRQMQSWFDELDWLLAQPLAKTLCPIERLAFSPPEAGGTFTIHSFNVNL